MTPADGQGRPLASVPAPPQVTRRAAVHPNLAINWSRGLAYPQLGIDRFMAIEEFDGSPTLHSGVTDAATYEKVLELLASSERPQFVLDVTMQNHGGYDQGNVAPELLDAHGADYLVWTNYEVEGAGEQHEQLASASTLAALALDAIGAPLTSQQQALLGLRQDMPAVGYVSYAARDGGLHASELEPTSELDTTADLEDAAEQARLAFEALAHIQYRRFAERV